MKSTAPGCEERRIFAGKLLKMAQYYKFDKEKASRRPGVKPFKEALELMIDSYRMRTSYNESYVTAHWEKIMGKAISTRTKEVYVKDGTLFIKIDSAPLREELVRAKPKIIELINSEMNSDLIKEVVFI